MTLVFRVVLVVSVSSVVVMRVGCVVLSNTGVGAMRRGGRMRVLHAGFSVVVTVWVVASVHAPDRIPLGGMCRGVGFRCQHRRDRGVEARHESHHDNGSCSSAEGILAGGQNLLASSCPAASGPFRVS